MLFVGKRHLSLIYGLALVVSAVDEGRGCDDLYGWLHSGRDVVRDLFVYEFTDEVEKYIVDLRDLFVPESEQLRLVTRNQTKQPCVLWLICEQPLYVLLN